MHEHETVNARGTRPPTSKEQGGDMKEGLEWRASDATRGSLMPVCSRVGKMRGRERCTPGDDTDVKHEAIERLARDCLLCRHGPLAHGVVIRGAGGCLQLAQSYGDPRPSPGRRGGGGGRLRDGLTCTAVPRDAHGEARDGEKARLGTRGESAKRWVRTW